MSFPFLAVGVELHYLDMAEDHPLESPDVQLFPVEEEGHLEAFLGDHRRHLPGAQVVHREDQKEVLVEGD